MEPNPLSGTMLRDRSKALGYIFLCFLQQPFPKIPVNLGHSALEILGWNRTKVGGALRPPNVFG